MSPTRRALAVRSMNIPESTPAWPANLSLARDEGLSRDGLLQNAWKCGSFSIVEAASAEDWFT
jgi:hypothetical protein